jgi:hypothetical protein
LMGRPILKSIGSRRWLRKTDASIKLIFVKNCRLCRPNRHVVDYCRLGVIHIVHLKTPSLPKMWFKPTGRMSCADLISVGCDTPSLRVPAIPRCGTTGNCRDVRSSCQLGMHPSFPKIMSAHSDGAPAVPRRAKQPPGCRPIRHIIQPVIGVARVPLPWSGEARSRDSAMDRGPHYYGCDF